MKTQSRRNFLKSSAIGLGALTLASDAAQAAPKNILSEDRHGVLVDTTVCIGCRSCEWACKKAHNLPTSDLDDYKDKAVLQTYRRPDNSSLTVVNEYHNPVNERLPIGVKIQCMHCDRPACVSACIVGAITKEEDGSVIWDGKKCIGCRYCIVACPFQVPTFDYQKAIEPDIRKCDFCHERTKSGTIPACVEICPVEALIYGPRSELIKEARHILARNPDHYINHIFGEYEVGGTGWLYLANRKFIDIGFPNVAMKPAPGVSESIQHGIFAYFVPPVIYYSLLGIVMWISKRNAETKEWE